MKDPQTPRKITFFCKPLTKLGTLIMASFSSTSEMKSSNTNSQAQRKRSPGLFTILHKEVTAASTAKPTRRSPSKSKKLAVSHSICVGSITRHLDNPNNTTIDVRLSLVHLPSSIINMHALPHIRRCV
jgi:hypothetical protein